MLSRASLRLNYCCPGGMPLVNELLHTHNHKVEKENFCTKLPADSACNNVTEGMNASGWWLLCLRCLSISGLTAAADRVMPFCGGPNTPQNGACSPGSLWLTITNRGHNILHRTHQSSPPAAANTQPFQVSCYHI